MVTLHTRDFAIWIMDYVVVSMFRPFWIWWGSFVSFYREMNLTRIIFKAVSREGLVFPRTAMIFIKVNAKAGDVLVY